MELRLLRSSSTLANRSSHPLISLHLLWYLTSSSSYEFQNSLIVFSMFSRMSSPRATFNTSLIWASNFSKFTFHSYPSVISRQSIFCMWILFSSVFQCLSFMASLFSSKTTRFIFLYSFSLCCMRS